MFCLDYPPESFTESVRIDITEPTNNLLDDFHDGFDMFKAFIDNVEIIKGPILYAKAMSFVTTAIGKFGALLNVISLIASFVAPYSFHSETQQLAKQLNEQFKLIHGRLDGLYKRVDGLEKSLKEFIEYKISI